MNTPYLAPARTAWLQDIGLGLAVFILGVVEATQTRTLSRQMFLLRCLVVLAVAAGVALHRQAPGVALLMMWSAVGVHGLSGTPIMLVEMATAVVAFGTARYGSTAIIWLSGISMPAGILVLIYVAIRSPFVPFASILDVRYLPLSHFYLGHLPTVFVGGLLLLVVPWMSGLVLRSRAATRQSQTDQAVAEQERAAAESARDQASEIARLRAQQVQLANDVHDVVGHSLTVILAQAESAQFLPEGDRDRVRQTFENIATSARDSLGDVRQVLSSTVGAARPGQAATLDSLIDGVRAAGNDVRSQVVGSPQPLPPELDAVAFRVLQEMLTNALKHGRRGAPLQVERHWHGELRIEVSNAMDITEHVSAGAQRPAGGAPLGLDGMRRRLESVGGRLDVRQRGQDGQDGQDVGATFTVTAWVPLRPVHG